MRHTRLPLYAILGAVLIIAAWAHSFWKITSIKFYGGPPSAQHVIGCDTHSGIISIATGRLPSGISISGWDRFRFVQVSNRRLVRWSHFKPVTFSEPGDYRGVSINFYVIFLLYTAFWLTLLTRLSRRRKSHPTPPIPDPRSPI